jgi:hypothetical protein
MTATPEVDILPTMNDWDPYRAAHAVPERVLASSANGQDNFRSLLPPRAI